MPRKSSLSPDQQVAAVALFEVGCGRESVATQLGVRPALLRRLYDRWRLWGPEVLVPNPSTRRYPFETKWEIIQRFEAGESKVALAQEYKLSGPSLIEAWLRTYRAKGVDGLRPPLGRPPRAAPEPETELEQLRRENLRLRAEVAYLGKLKALIAAERR